jgi:hypothetical protein
MVMGPGLRKLALSVHLAVSVGWIGAAAAYLAVGLVAGASEDVRSVRSAWIAMDLIGWYVIVPMAIASLLTGLVMAFGTRWGLLRHYWVLFSFVLTIVATAVLLLHMPDVSVTVAAVRRTSNPAGHLDARLGEGDVLHPGLGLVVLLVIHVLNVHKPAGMTRYGQRKQHEERLRARRGPV